MRTEDPWGARHQGATEGASAFFFFSSRDENLPAARTSSASMDPASALAGLRLLIVEDNDDTRELWELVLSSAGAVVTSAPACDAALAVFRPGAFDLVLCDIAMPGKNGLDCIRAIREREREQACVAVRALAASGNTRHQDVGAALDAGFDAFLPKPVLPDVLVERLAQLLTR